MKKLAFLAAVSVLLSACASSVKTVDTFDGQPVQNANFQAQKGFHNISMKLSEEAKAELPDNMKFNADTLRSTVERALKAHNLTSSNGSYTMDITVTDIRTRSSFSAVMFGFMAGDDHVKGLVTVLDKQKSPLKSFEIEANYALGGIAGGMDESRMNWLYEKFAELTLNQLVPQEDKSASLDTPSVRD